MRLGRMMLTLVTALAPLGAHVHRVIGLCPKKQVIGTHARGIVASVQDKYVRRDWAVDFLP